MPLDALDEAWADDKMFRRALGTFPTGVAVMTTGGSGNRPVGLTVNSFASLSLAPPLVTWALKKESPSLDDFRRRGRFMVNLLAFDQREISARFARPIPDKFDGVQTRETASGLPLIEGCAAYLDCSVHAEHLIGDHVLFVGLVHDVRVCEKMALGYYRGSYFEPLAAS